MKDSDLLGMDRTLMDFLWVVKGVGPGLCVIHKTFINNQLTC